MVAGNPAACMGVLLTQGCPRPPSCSQSFPSGHTRCAGCIYKRCSCLPDVFKGWSQPQRPAASHLLGWERLANDLSLATRPTLCSWSTSGLGFATFWLLGFLRVFDGSVQPLRFVGALSPLLGALWIGMSRIQVRRAAGQPACGRWRRAHAETQGRCWGVVVARQRRLVMPATWLA